ncbi:MAG: hypothetical protein ACYSP9_05565 [Planctomycetota bacterium]
MNTFWLKIAGIVVVIVGVIVLVNALSSSESKGEKEHKPETFWEQVREDDKRLRADPELREPPVSDEGSEAGNPQFKELSEIERIDAEQRFNVALQHRKMGRLQGIGLRTMVDCCRQIIERYPDSEYAFKAKRMLADIPERFRSRYNITEEETDLGDWK